MKVKTAVISVVVSASLVAGAGYGAYYAMKGKASPVQVVPVANVNMNYGGMMLGDESTIYGSVTSQVAQTVTLKDNYSVKKIYVEEGDQVKEGDPLFEYDMTFPELELEMAKLNLQSQELTKVRLEKELEKLKNTKATASLSVNASVMTTASEDGILDERNDVIAEENGAAGERDTDSQENGSTEKKGADDGSKKDVTVEGIETAENPELTDENTEDTEEQKIKKLVEDFELLVAQWKTIVSTDGDTLPVGFETREKYVEQFDKLLASWQNNIVDEVTEKTGDGETAAIHSYRIKSSVEALYQKDQDGLNALRQSILDLNQMQVRFVQFLIRDLNPEAASFVGDVKKAEEEYRALATELQNEKLSSDDKIRLKEMKEKASGMLDEPENPNSSEKPSEEDSSGKEKESEQTEPSTDASLMYTVMIKDGRIENTGRQTASYHPHDTVTITADAGDETQDFIGWQVTHGNVVLTDASAVTTTFEMPETNVEVEAVYAGRVQSYADAFLSLAENALGADGETRTSFDPVQLWTAIDFYQSNLAEEDSKIADGSDPTMDSYILKASFESYLKENGKDGAVSYLPKRYKTLCVMYVKTLIDRLDPKALTRGDLETAKKAYTELGEAWQKALNALVKSDESSESGASGQDTASRNGETTPAGDEAEASGEEGEAQSEEAGNGEHDAEAAAGIGTAAPAVLNYGEMLAAYEVILEIMEIEKYQSQPELLLAYLTQVKADYLALSEGQQSVVWNSAELIELLKKNGLWESGGNEMPDPGYGGGDSGFEEPGYTAEELKVMIEDAERGLKECDLAIREAQLNVDKQQRTVDNKIVRSTMEGTVVKIGTDTGDSEDDNTFAKVVNATGLFVRGSMNELALSKIKVGDTISGQTDDGMEFTAVIKEISEYPDANGSNYSYSGSENTNASYYPFFAQLDDPEGISEGGATIQLSGTLMNDNDAIYIEKYFIRTESDGRSCVYMEGKGGKLMKQYVTTGRTLWDSVIEITSGLSKMDKIAFPYGDDVFEGADTKEVESLDDLYS